MNKNRPLPSLLPGLLALLLSPGLFAVDHYFTSPDAPFVIASNGVVRNVPLPAGSVETAQGIIDAARQQDSNAVLFLQPAGDLVVGAAPLQLGSRMCLQLSSGAGIKAGASCSAASLISVNGAADVSVSSPGNPSALIDGGGRAVTGISVVGGTRVYLDRLTVTRCGGSGIDYKGSAPLAPNAGGSVTRSLFQGNGDGVRVDQSAGFVCLDNDFVKNGGTGLSINSLTPIVAGNSFTGNRTALSSGSDRGVITRNSFGTNGTILDLNAGSSANLVSENIASGTVTLSVAGSGHSLFHNAFAGSAAVAPDARKIYVLENGDLATDTRNTNILFFNPPTRSNPHSNPVIVTGMGRCDISVNGGFKVKPPKPANPAVKTPPANKAEPIIPVDIATAQEALDKARAEHPNDVIVLHLAGEFVSKNPSGLRLPANSCVLLGDTRQEARILADLGIPNDPLWNRAAPITQVVLMAPKGFSSLSGGKIDAGRQAFHGVNASSNASSIAIVDGVNVAATAFDGIYIKGRMSYGPLFLYNCNVYASGSRCIWPHVCTPVHCIGNVCVGGGHDGIDFDAGARDCTALFNVCSGNKRHGLFIEEAAHNNIAFGNNFSNNDGAGVHVWNEEVTGNTGSNCIVANLCERDYRGVSVGGRSADKTANENLVFNNVCRANRLEGVSPGNSHATRNTFGQCVVGQNMGRQLPVSGSAESFFFNVIPPSDDSR
jgi:hypothetical protein